MGFSKVRGPFSGSNTDESMLGYMRGDPVFLEIPVAKTLFRNVWRSSRKSFLKPDLFMSKDMRKLFPFAGAKGWCMSWVAELSRRPTGLKRMMFLNLQAQRLSIAAIITSFGIVLGFKSHLIPYITSIYPIHNPYITRI